mgnify:CR=1 FL=1
MTLEKRITRLEEAIKPPGEPFLITIRVVGSPPIPQERIDAAMTAAREEGRDVAMVRSETNEP